MYWSVLIEERDEGAAGDDFSPAGRFVLHRHRDPLGAHLDLRLEQERGLVGWRVASDSLEGKPWATGKLAHPKRWLEEPGDAEVVDGGLYRWVERGPQVQSVELRGRQGVRLVRMEREAGLSVEAVRAICAALGSGGAGEEAAADLVRDGMAARQRAIGRLCGLGRELDGDAFDGEVWKRMLGSMSLDEIHGQLRAYEVRFDRKYPPQPISAPGRLEEAEGSGRSRLAMSIVRRDGDDAPGRSAGVEEPQRKEQENGVW